MGLPSLCGMLNYYDEPMGKITFSRQRLVQVVYVGDKHLRNLGFKFNRRAPESDIEIRHRQEKTARDSKSCLNYEPTKLLNAFTSKFLVRCCLVVPDMMNNKSSSVQRQLSDVSTSPKPFSSSFLEKSSECLSLVNLVDP